MGDTEDRRVADEQARREFAERLAKVELSLQNLGTKIDGVKDEISQNKIDQLTLHYTLFGGPEPDKEGLLERFRKMATRDKWVIWAVAVILGFLGKLASPLYDKWVADWAYSSVSERWMRENARPKIKHIHVTVRAPLEEDLPVPP